jgi:hypothetical protein
MESSPARYGWSIISSYRCTPRSCAASEPCSNPALRFHPRPVLLCLRGQRGTSITFTTNLHAKRTTRVRGGSVKSCATACSISFQTAGHTRCSTTRVSATVTLNRQQGISVGGLSATRCYLVPLRVVHFEGVLLGVAGSEHKSYIVAGTQKSGIGKKATRDRYYGEARA